MKKAKLLSFILAASLLFNTAGIDVLATASSNPVPVSDMAETTDSNISEPSSKTDNETEETNKEESNPEHSFKEDDVDKEPTGEEISPKQPAEENSESKMPAEEDADSEQSSEENNAGKAPAEEDANSEPPSEENSENKVPAEEASDLEQPSTEDNLTENEDPSEDILSPEELPTEDSVSENTITEDTTSESSLPEEEEDAFGIFPGLGENYTMSPQQMANKEVLASHMSEFVKINSRNAKDYLDTKGIYELGEVVYLAKDEAEAKQVAKAFGGTLDSYSYEVAVIALPQNVTVALAVAAAADPDTKLPAIWPNYYHHLESDFTEVNTTATPSDPGLANQWQHDYIGTRYAWAAGFKGEGIKVAVIDTGLTKDHPDLSKNAIAGRNFVNGANGTEQNTDNQTHGTHVAGIIAADDNGIGGVGIAPDATVRGYCVFSPTGDSDTDSILRAINAAVADGNDIINMSLGSSYYDKNYEDVVNAAYEKGVALFAASGNSNTDGYSFPAAFSHTISVGAIDQNSARASFSNYGSTVTLSFPGVKIYSTLPSNYGYMNGTSQASPAAAGTAAVILSANEAIRNKTGKARVDALISAMKSSTTKCSSSGMGAGTTWLPGALKIATDMTAPDAPVITVVNSDETPYKMDAAGKNYLEKEINISLSTKTAVGVEVYYTTDGKNPTYKDGAVTNATLYTPDKPITLGGAKKVTIKAIALNPITGMVSKAVSKTFSLTPIPTEVTLAPANNVSRIAAGMSLKFTAAVSPAYAVSSKVQWSVDATAKSAGITVSNGTVKTKATTPEGTYTITATAVGSDGKTFNGVQKDYPFTVIKSAEIKKVSFWDSSTNKALKPKPLNIKNPDINDPNINDPNINDPDIDLKAFLKVTKIDNTELSPADAAAAVVWSSSNTKIAKVDNGIITALAPGKAVIKATSNDGGNKSASYNVTVNQPVTGITLSGPQKIAAGRGITLTAKVTPANATNKKLDWKVDGNDKVTVSAAGKVSAKKDASGTYTVTATAKDGSAVSAAYEITIILGEITNITLSDTSKVLFPPKTGVNAPTTATLTATVDGTTGADKTLVTWTSSAPSIVSVNKDTGDISAKKSGKAIITCSSTDGSNKKATCTVNVTIPMSNLSIGPADSYGNYFDQDNFQGYGGYIAAGKSIKMIAKYTSNYGIPTNKKVTWKSSDESVLSVDQNGKVTANKNAENKTAVITATAADGSGVTSNEYTFSVTKPYNRITIENGFVVVGWADDGHGYTIPYYTITVSGGKNPGLSKEYDAYDGCYYFEPIPGEVTTLKPSSSTSLYTNELQKMTMTVKLQDGSGLTAKKSVYVARFSDNTIKFFK